jgi:hypothetical protein
MKHIKIFEDFNQFKKPSLLQKAVQAGKRFIGYEKKEDREALDKIYRAIGYKDPSGIPDRTFVENIREIKPGVIVAWILGKSITVDSNESTIMYNGKNLELTDMEYECDSLYHVLSNMI